jgi:hypothetical protein
LGKRKEVVADNSVPTILEPLCELVHYSLAEASFRLRSPLSKIWNHVVNVPALATDNCEDFETVVSGFRWDVLPYRRLLPSIRNHNFVTVEEFLGIVQTLQHCDKVLQDPPYLIDLVIA